MMRGISLRTCIRCGRLASAICQRAATVRERCSHDEPSAPSRSRLVTGLVSVLVATSLVARAQNADYRVFVTNERSGDVTVIDPNSRTVVATIPVGTRPRGIHPSPDGTRIYVALSGTPISGPPSSRGATQPRTPPSGSTLYADRSADAIGVIGCASNKLIAKLPSGIDPENFSLSRGGTR